MSEKENRNSEPIMDLVSYYQQEMNRNIFEIRRLISELENEDGIDNILQEIKKIGMALCDLAMVYGFENEEVIGRNIALTVDSYNQEEGMEKLISKLKDSADAAEEMILSNDDKNVASILVNEVVEDSDQVDGLESDEDDELGDLLFDIKEDESLFSIVNGKDSGNSNSNKNGVEEVILREEQNQSLHFDIPEDDNSKSELKVSFTELDDVMEIEFSEKSLANEKEQKSIFKKISRLFSSKN